MSSTRNTDLPTDQMSLSDTQPRLVDGDFFPIFEDEENADQTEYTDTSAVEQRTLAPRKRISWADDNLVSAPFEFFLSLKSSSLPEPVVGSPLLPQPRAIFKEKQNGDGTSYLFFPSQRPSVRILEQRNSSKKSSVLFAAQPNAKLRRPTLLRALVGDLSCFSEGEKKRRATLSRTPLPLSPASGRILGIGESGRV